MSQLLRDQRQRVQSRVAVRRNPPQQDRGFREADLHDLLCFAFAGEDALLTFGFRQDDGLLGPARD